MKKISIRTDVLGLPLRQSLDLAAQWGVSAVELDARNQVRPSEFSDTAIRQLRKMLDDRNLRVSSLRFVTRRGYDVAADLDRRIDATKDVMKLAHRLGANLVINSLGRIPAADSIARAPFEQVIDDLGRHGARVGAFLAAETGQDDPAELRAVLDASEDGYVAVALHPGQLIIHQHDIANAVTVLGSRVGIVHAVDGVLDLAEGRGLTVPLGQGIADFPSILGRLEEHGFDGFRVVGRRGGGGDVAQSLAYLREVSRA
ncbi:MAG: sugar phosphate isomerase/epimerase family protein [Planctomycetota bacterium]